MRARWANQTPCCGKPRRSCSSRATACVTTITFICASPARRTKPFRVAAAGARAGNGCPPTSPPAYWRPETGTRSPETTRSTSSNSELGNCRKQCVASSVRLGRGQLLRGDCLPLLSELDAELSGHFDLAYMDPPFNAGGERGAREKKGERVSGRLAYKDAWGGLDAFLSMLEPRLVAVRDALSAVGSLWLHLDHRAVHDAKVLSDRIFGRTSFQGEVIWVPGNGGKRRAGPSVTHQTILIFAR